MQSMKPTFVEEKKTMVKIVSGSKNVNNEQVKLNQTKAKNQKLRKDIDILRKELTSAN
jgi:hypothetical protein